MNVGHRGDLLVTGSPDAKRSKDESGLPQGVPELPEHRHAAAGPLGDLVQAGSTDVPPAQAASGEVTNGKLDQLLALIPMIQSSCENQNKMQESLDTLTSNFATLARVQGELAQEIEKRCDANLKAMKSSMSELELRLAKRIVVLESRSPPSTCASQGDSAQDERISALEVQLKQAIAPSHFGPHSRNSTSLTRRLILSSDDDGASAISMSKDKVQREVTTFCTRLPGGVLPQISARSGDKVVVLTFASSSAADHFDSLFAKSCLSFSHETAMISSRVARERSAIDRYCGKVVSIIRSQLENKLKGHEGVHVEQSMGQRGGVHIVQNDSARTVISWTERSFTSWNIAPTSAVAVVGANLSADALNVIIQNALAQTEDLKCRLWG